MLQILKVKLNAKAPLLLHNSRLANPLDPVVKEIKKLTGKKKKTDADLERIAKLEWSGGLYLQDNRVVIPAKMITATIRNGARAYRKGKVIQAGVWCDQDAVPLDYEGRRDPFDLEKEWDKRHLVKNLVFCTQAVVMRKVITRTRPIFHHWSLTFDLS